MQRLNKKYSNLRWVRSAVTAALLSLAIALGSRVLAAGPGELFE